MSGVQQLLSDNTEVVGLYLLMSRLGLQHNSSYTAESSARLALSRGPSKVRGRIEVVALGWGILLFSMP